MLGKSPGPIIQGQRTFVIVIGLFDKDGNQQVHRYDTGEEVPIVFLSNPIRENPGRGILH